MVLREQMLEMLDCTRIEESHVGLPGDFLMATSYAAMINANVYLFAENDLHAYVRLFKSWDLKVRRVVCTEPKEFRMVDDVEIVSPQDLLTDETPRKVFFIFNSERVSGYAKNFLDTQITEIPSAETPNLTFMIPTNKAWSLNTNTNERFDTNRIYYYQSHKAELMELFDSLADETSKCALFYFIESYVRNCVYGGEQIPTRWKYFFGGKYERLYKHLDGEVWINCGASEGDTVFQYFSFDFKPKKVYAFEGDEETFVRMLNNLSLLPPEKRSLVEPINEMIDATTDFEKILAGNKCTLLNADIEGAELSMLRSMEKIIRADRPVIAICAYHFKEDLLTLPQFIRSICNDYVFYLRKYTAWVKNVKKNHELVLYAVPKERLLWR